MYIILPINNSPERISYLSGKGNGFLFFRFWNPGGTYIRLFRETMPISRIGKRKMLYRLLIKNFILLSVLVFLSLSLNLLCVHLMFRGGKYNPSEISALNVFTMFWTNHRAYSDHMYYLWHYGYVLLCNILLFPQPKNGIFCKYIFLAD